MKILNVITDSNIGGAGRQLLSFLRCCDRDRFDITVALPAGALLTPSLMEIGVRCLEIDGIAEKSFSVPAIWSLRRLFMREKPDIVHAHASMSARIAAKAARCRIVYTRHSVFENRRIKTVFPARQLLGAVNNFFADAVIAVSPAARDILVEAGQAPGKIRVIYNGVEALPAPDPRLKAETRSSYGLKDDDFVCGIFARITPVKGHEYILSAAETLKNIADVKFVIAGTGESEGDLKKRADAAGIGNVIFTGFLEDAGDLMGAIDVQINASYGTEATSLSLLEGMSMGIPAVVSSFGGNPYVINDGVNGLVFAERDAGALAGAIMKLYNDKALYAEMSVNAERVYRERFTAAEMAKNIGELYMELGTVQQ